MNGICRNKQKIVGKKIYLTGGIGSRGEYEAFGENYKLPNEDAYAETCASVGNILWNQRLFQLEGSSWFEVACCPANSARLLASFSQFIYATSDEGIFINLFVGSRASFKFKDCNIELSQRTNYPWEGSVKIGINPSTEKEFKIYVRIPGWALGKPVPTNLYSYPDKKDSNELVKLNGKIIPLSLERGYLQIKRRWKKEDSIEVQFSMPIRRVLAHENVLENRGKVAIERGPLVFCAEGGG